MSEWISVKDRLPDDDAYILVWVTTSSHCEIARFVKNPRSYSDSSRYEIKKY